MTIHTLTKKSNHFLIKDGSKEAIKAVGNMCDKIVSSMDVFKDASKEGKIYKKAMEEVAFSSK